MLDPRRLLTFREVARTGSFTRAAEALSLTQPAVSQQIRALEMQLGEPLMLRRRGGLTLTPAGELLLEHADAVWERLALAEAQLDEVIREQRRRLDVGAFPSVLATLVPAAVADVQSSVEELELSVVQGSADELVGAVREGRLHLALCFQDAGEPRREHEDLRRSDLFEVPMVALVGPDHRLCGRKRIRLEELAGDTWTAATPDGLIWRACFSAGFEPRLAYLTADPLAIRGLVASHLAVTLTGRLLAGQLEGVAIVELVGEPARQAVYAVTPRAGVHPLADSFLDAMRAEYSALGIRRSAVKTPPSGASSTPK
jgi:DNA-binding transcriptional LysR family regulator